MMYPGRAFVFSKVRHIYSPISPRPREFSPPKNMIKSTVAVYPGTSIRPVHLLIKTTIAMERERLIPSIPRKLNNRIGRSENAKVLSRRYLSFRGKDHVLRPDKRRLRE